MGGGDPGRRGLDPRPLTELIERILDTSPGLQNPVAIHSVLIARHGKLVLEEYFYGTDGLRPHDMRSASKTFAPALIGIARQNGVRLRPRDQLKLGQLYLNGGTWNGKRIVGQDWASESTSVHATFTPQPPFDTDHGYGYGWHSRPLEFGGHTYRDYYAAGNGGQYLIVIPSLGLVVA